MSKLKDDNIALAVNYCEELKQLISSLCEDIVDSWSMTEAWHKIDRFYQDAEALRNQQKCTGSKSFSIRLGQIESVEGHTKYLQGLHLPIMVNSICDSEGNSMPSAVSEMHIGDVNGVQALLITPEIISIP